MTPKSRIDNPDFVPIAVHRLGGVGQFVDVEDVFVECWRMAPERFGWRKHEYPNYKIVSKALRDLEDKEPELLIKTEDGLGRQLTAEGVEWVRHRLPLFEQITRRAGGNPPTRRPSQRILNEIRDHPLFRSFLAGEDQDLAKYEVADLLMCSPDSPTTTWRERLETYRAAAAEADRTEIQKFLDHLEQQAPDWFQE